MIAWGVIMIIGFLPEAIGLGVAAHGLLRTWRENANGRPFFSPRLHRVVDRIRAKLGYPAGAPGGGFLSAPSATLSSATGLAPFVMNSALDVDGKIEALAEGINRALEKATQALHAAQVEAGKRRSGDAALEQVIAQSELQLKSYSQRLVVDGVPQAISGLFSAALGLVLQGCASISTFGWPS